MAVWLIVGLVVVVAFALLLALSLMTMAKAADRMSDLDYDKMVADEKHDD